MAMYRMLALYYFKLKYNYKKKLIKDKTIPSLEEEH